MSVVMGISTVPSNSTVPVFTLPPGCSSSTVYQMTFQVQPVYIGTSPHVSATNGMPVPNTPSNGETYVGSAPVLIYATTGNATASSFYYLISTTGLA